MDTKTEDENSPECNPTPPQCTPAEQEQQEESLGSIMNKMCNIDPAQLSFPVTLYLVQLCDGSLVYILGADLLRMQKIIFLEQFPSQLGTGETYQERVLIKKEGE